MNNSDVKIAAGIVLFNPEVKRLHENVDAIYTQVEEIVFIENGSSDTDYLNDFLGERITLIKNKKNEGIAFALNQICQYCEENHFDYVLTLDQDSVVSPDIIKNYKKFIGDDVGILCPKVIDRNFKRIDEKEEFEIKEIDWCITSASFTNVAAWSKVGGFDSSMFIDWVDWDFCIALKNNGYKILQTTNARILHELGENSRIKRVGGREIFLLNRTPFRYYYVIRNQIYIGRKWPQISLGGRILESLRTIYYVIVYESHKYSNWCAMMRGFFDGFRMPLCYRHNRQ